MNALVSAIFFASILRVLLFEYIIRIVQLSKLTEKVVIRVDANSSILGSVLNF